MTKSVLRVLPNNIPNTCLFKGRIAPLPDKSNPYLQSPKYLLLHSVSKIGKGRRQSDKKCTEV